MHAHWTQDHIKKEVIDTLVEENISEQLICRLMARIARRDGKQRLKVKDVTPPPSESEPILPEAA